MKKSKAQALNKVMENSLDDKILNNKKMVNRIRKDVLFSDYYYGMDPEEYFRYGFRFLSKAGRNEYVGDRERFPKFKKMADPDAYRILNIKILAYEKFKEFYNRELIEVKDEADYELFSAFCSRHEEFIIKPYNATGGRGVRVGVIREQSDIRKVFDEIIATGESVIEERIEQHPGMAKFHPESVNTVRLVTFYDKGKIRILQTSVRIGAGDTVVDNGCLSAAIDPETGVIITPGRQSHRKGLYNVHPDTGVKILGNNIPMWDELLELSKKLPLVLPMQKLVGWDLALSNDGWVMIGGNSCPAVQILSGHGMGVRNWFDEITAGV